MRVFSRELFVGFLLVLALLVLAFAAGACQPVQPEAAASVGNETISESGPVTDTATLANTPASEGISVTTVAESSDPALLAAGLAVYRA